MPVKVILIIIVVVLVSFLSGFNWKYTCTLWFFKEIKDIPVFVLAVAAFALGILFTLPFTFGKFKLKKQLKQAKAELEDLKKSIGMKLSSMNESEAIVTQEQVESALKTAGESFADGSQPASQKKGFGGKFKNPLKK